LQIEAELALTIEAMQDAENAKQAMLRTEAGTLRIEAIAEVAKQDAENSKEDEAAAEES
jgi:hypothetical protein